MIAAQIPSARTTTGNHDSSASQRILERHILSTPRNPSTPPSLFRTPAIPSPNVGRALSHRLRATSSRIAHPNLSRRPPVWDRSPFRGILNNILLTTSDVSDTQLPFHGVIPDGGPPSTIECIHTSNPTHIVPRRPRSTAHQSPAFPHKVKTAPHSHWSFATFISDAVRKLFDRPGRLEMLTTGPCECHNKIITMGQLSPPLSSRLLVPFPNCDDKKRFVFFSPPPSIPHQRSPLSFIFRNDYAPRLSTLQMQIISGLFTSPGRPITRPLRIDHPVFYFH